MTEPAGVRTSFIPIADIDLVGDFAVPPRAVGMVVFVHGSGSSRLSPRNRFVASTLRARGLATLLFDLLTPDEERRDAIDGSLRFDIPLLAERLGKTTDWLVREGVAGSLPIAYFGASTGAAAALICAAQRPDTIASVVSRGGRPDLAAEILEHVRAPTLLVVGSNDPVVLGLNRSAADRIAGPCEVAVVPGATHLFEEPGALEAVAGLAGDWILHHLPSRRPEGTLSR